MIDKDIYDDLAVASLDTKFLINQVDLILLQLKPKVHFGIANQEELHLSFLMKETKEKLESIHRIFKESASNI